jgi:hypothetical protein
MARSFLLLVVRDARPRLIGVGFKRVPKFGFLLGISYFIGDGEVGMIAATGASIFSVSPRDLATRRHSLYLSLLDLRWDL